MQDIVEGFIGESYSSDKHAFHLPYRLFIPKDYDPSHSYPLVVAMHGVGKKGEDNRQQITKAPWATVWAMGPIQAKYPAFVFAPQCPSTNSWVNTNFRMGSYDMDRVDESPALLTAMEVLNQLLARYSIDRSRIYVNGNSMGAYATWYMAVKYKELFAAAAPFAGAGDPSKANRLATIPVWAFHSSNDHVVPVSGSREMIQALKAQGGDPRYTEDRDAGHAVVQVAFSLDEDKDGEPDLVTWMFAQRKTGI